MVGQSASNGPLIKQYRRRFVYDAALPISAKVAVVINDSWWRWPISKSEVLVSVQVGICDTPDASDLIQWSLSNKGEFTLESTWHYLRENKTRVNWGYLNISTFSFVTLYLKSFEYKIYARELRKVN